MPTLKVSNARSGPRPFSSSCPRRRACPAACSDRKRARPAPSPPASEPCATLAMSSSFGRVRLVRGEESGVSD